MSQTSMRPMPSLLWLLLVTAGLSLTACSGGTQFSSTWTNPEYAEKQEVNQVLVVGVAENEDRRRMFETELANRLKSQGIAAYPSIQFHTSVDQMQKADVEKIIKEQGIQAVIVTRLVDLNRQDVYVPPTTYVSSYPAYGSPYYGSMYGYYSYGYSVTHDPGYTYEKVTVTLETNLYDAANEQLIWSGQSNTFDPSGAQDVVGPTASLIVEELVNRKLLSPKK